MTRMYLLGDGPEIARRRPLVPAGTLVEAWPDLYVKGEFWAGERTKRLLDEVGGALPAKLALDASGIAVFYGPRLADVDSLPDEESLRGRVLSAHGIAAAWITIDRFGERTVYEPAGPEDPVFYLRRPGGSAAHVWRLFRERREAQVYMAEHFGKDSEGRQWADRLPSGNWEEMVARYGS